MPPESTIQVTEYVPKKHWRKALYIAASTILVILIVIMYFLTAPAHFPSGSIVRIDNGTTLSGAAKMLADKGVIRSQLLYKTYVRIMGGSTNVVMGDYLFDHPASLIQVANRTMHGDYRLARIKVTIPEGLSSKDIAAILAKNISGFDVNDFVESAKTDEGYLFPDTYFLYQNSSVADVIKEMKANFENKIVTIKSTLASSTISSSTRSLSDVITMASIIEKEATSSVDRRIIAGILWKRLDAGMPLQVDPPFYYLLNKTSDQLTLDDLAIDSKYNLYKNIGLPPTPISNPGLDAIIDTINPTNTQYWFYLSDKKGSMHYASTFQNHVANKAKYL